MCTGELQVSNRGHVCLDLTSCHSRLDRDSLDLKFNSDNFTGFATVIWNLQFAEGQLRRHMSQLQIIVTSWKSNLFYLQANSCWPLSELRFWTGWCCCRGRYFKEGLIYGPPKYCSWRHICACRESNNNSVLTSIHSRLKSKWAFIHNSAIDDDSVLLGHQNHHWGPDYWSRTMSKWTPTRVRNWWL